MYNSVRSSTVCSSGHRYGEDDELGTLNRLTNDVVLEAAKEIKTGTRQVFMPYVVSSVLISTPRISLNWALDAQTTPFFGRQVCYLSEVTKTLCMTQRSYRVSRRRSIRSLLDVRRPKRIAEMFIIASEPVIRTHY